MSDYGLSCCYKSAGLLFVIVIDVWLWCPIMMSDYGLSCCYKSAGVLFVFALGDPLYVLAHVFKLILFSYTITVTAAFVH